MSYKYFLIALKPDKSETQFTTTKPICCMKYIFLVLSLVTCIASGQDIKVKGIKQLLPEQKGDYTISGVMPDGRELLITGPNASGLSVIDIKSGKTRIVTKSAGAGYQPVISSDGQNICYRSDDYSGFRKMTYIIKADVFTGDTLILQPRSREITTPGSTGNTIMFKSGGKMIIRDIKDSTLKSAVNQVCVMADGLTPVLYYAGKSKEYKPGGDGSYIWISLSPDKTKMVYCLVGKGTFISDLEGNIIASAGKINAPKWLNNNIIIGMDDSDNGYNITSSEIIAYSLSSGKTSRLTNTSSRIEVYPFPLPDGKRISFTTTDGRIFIMKIKVKQ